MLGLPGEEGMKRFAAVVMFALLLAPARSGAVSLSLLPDPAVPPASFAPAPNAPAGENGRLGRFLDRPGEPAESKTGWFVGPLLWKVSLDLSALDPMTVNRKVSALEDNPYIIGAMGGVIRDNWRFGGLYVTGVQSSWSMVAGDWRGARIKIDAFGVFVDYDRELKTARDKKYYNRVPYLRYGYLGGAILAYGQLGLEADGPDLGHPEKWSNTQGIGIVNPYVGLWISPFDWVWAQLEVGYILILMQDQQLTNDDGDLMVNGAIGGGPHIGVKLVFGSNPNFKVKVPAPR